MSSKLIDGEKAGAARPIEWRAVGGSGPALNGPTSAPARSETAPDSAPAANRLEQRIREMEQELEHRTAEAFERGRAAGQEAGRRESLERLEPALARMARSTEELAVLRRRVRADAEEDAVRLAVAVASKILHREITMDKEALLGLVKAAMQRLDASEVHRLRVHPEDVPGLERHLKRVGLPTLEIAADPSLERGAAVFETARGSLDASIETQLAEIERGFVDIVRRSGHAG